MDEIVSRITTNQSPSEEEWSDSVENNTDDKKEITASKNNPASKKRFREIDLTCALCKRMLFKPRVLGCLHTYCEDCLQNNVTFISAGYKDNNKTLIINNTSIAEEVEEEERGNEETGFVKCLICFEFSKLPPDHNVCMLPYNFFASNAIDYLMIQQRDENAILCTNCTDSSEAISRCAECSEFLCMACMTAHRRIRVTKEHKLTPLDTLRYDKSSVHHPVYCPDHEPELFTYYCEVCEDLICKECTILQHRGHKYECLSEALETRKPLITELLEINEKEKVPPISRAVEDVQDMAARLHARTIATKQAVRKCAEKCVKDIESRRDELLSNIDNLYKVKSLTLEQQQQDLQLRLMKNKSASQFVNYAFQHGNEVEIFELLDLMTMRLKSLNLKQLDYNEPDENDVIDHIYNTDAVNSIADNLGHVATSKIFLAHTKLYGPGLSTAKVEIETFFIIEVFDRYQQTCCDRFASDAVKVKVQAPEGFLVNNKITNNKDGTFTVKYTPVTKGKHDVTVKIRGKLFPHSKFAVRVYEGIDYRKVEEAYLCFGHRGAKSGEFKRPWCVVMNQQGHYFITDRDNNRVQVFDQYGVFMNSFGTRGNKNGQFSGPEGIAIDQSGIVFVSDSDNHRVQLFDPNGVFIGKFGCKGSKAGELMHPSGIAIERNGYVAVCDRDNHRIQLFSSDGEIKLVFGSYGKQYGQLNCPTHISIAENHSFLVCDSGNHRVASFDQKGLFSSEIGGGQGNDPGEFDTPTGIAVDREGYVLVGDRKNNRVQVFTAALKYYAQFGVHCDGDGINNSINFNEVCNLTLTNEGHVVVLDRGRHRVQVF